MVSGVGGALDASGGSRSETPRALAARRFIEAAMDVLGL